MLRHWLATTLRRSQPTSPALPLAGAAAWTPAIPAVDARATSASCASVAGCPGRLVHSAATRLFARSAPPSRSTRPSRPHPPPHIDPAPWEPVNSGAWNTPADAAAKRAHLDTHARHKHASRQQMSRILTSPSLPPSTLPVPWEPIDSGASKDEPAGTPRRHNDRLTRHKLTRREEARRSRTPTPSRSSRPPRIDPSPWESPSEHSAADATSAAPAADTAGKRHMGTQAQNNHASQEESRHPLQSTPPLPPSRAPPPPPPPPPPRAPAEEPTSFADFGPVLSPLLSRLGMLRTRPPVPELRSVYVVLRANDYAVLTSLSPAAAAYLFRALALAELSHSQLSPTGIRDDRPRPWKEALKPKHQLFSFVKGQMELLENQLRYYKRQPLDASLGRSLRASLRAVYLTVHAMGATNISELFVEKKPSWQVRAEEDAAARAAESDDPIAGGNTLKLRTYHPHDPLLFPHIPFVHVQGRVRLLVWLESLMLDHLDLFLFPPGTTYNDDLFRKGEKDGTDQTKGDTHDDSVLNAPRWRRSDLVCGASTPTLYPEETASYPHHRPWRNVIAWVRVLQSTRGGYASRQAIRALLRATGVPLTLLNTLRAKRQMGFGQLNVSETVFSRAMQAPDTPATTDQLPVEPLEAAEASEETDDNETPADKEAADDDDADNTASQAFDEEPTLDAQDREEQQRMQQMEQETAEAASDTAASPSAVPSSSAVAAVSASVSVSVPPPPLSVPARATMWFGCRLSESDMLCLVEAWALNNMDSGMRPMRSAMRAWLHMRARNKRNPWRGFSLIEMVRLMECFGLMEWHDPLVHALAERMEVFVRADAHPIGQPIDIMSMPATEVQARFEAEVQKRREQRKAEEGINNTETNDTTITIHSDVPSSNSPALPLRPVASAAVGFFHPSASSSSRRPLLFAHVLSRFLRRYGPLSMLRGDLSMQTVAVRLLSMQLEYDTSKVVRGPVRAMCDYFIRLMEEDETAQEMRRRHYPVSAAPHVDYVLLEELTDFAWSLVLRQLEVFEVVRQFMYAYIRWVERTFTVHTSDEQCTLTHRSSGVTLDRKHRVLFRMHQVSLSIMIAQSVQPLLIGMPRAFPAPTLPAEFNFSASTRDAILQYLKQSGSSDRHVSQLQMQLYQLMSDPQYGMGFRQRVMHDDAVIRMDRQTTEHHHEKEKALDAALAQHAVSPQAWIAPSASEEGDELLRLRDRMDASGVATEHTSESSAVDMFVEHSTAIGYTLDAAIVMRTTAHDQREAKPLKKHAAPQRLTDLPAIRALLPANVAAPTLRTMSVALEIDGPYHYSASSSVRYLNARSRLRRRHLRAHGWIVISVPFHKWNEFNQDPEKQAEFMRSILPVSMLKERRVVDAERREFRREDRNTRIQQIRHYINEVGSTVVTSPQHATKLVREKFAARHTHAGTGTRGVTAGRKVRHNTMATEAEGQSPAGASSARPPPLTAAAKHANLRAILDKFRQFKIGSGSS